MAYEVSGVLQSRDFRENLKRPDRRITEGRRRRDQGLENDRRVDGQITLGVVGMASINCREARWMWYKIMSYNMWNDVMWYDVITIQYMKISDGGIWPIGEL